MENDVHDAPLDVRYGRFSIEAFSELMVAPEGEHLLIFEVYRKYDGVAVNS